MYDTFGLISGSISGSTDLQSSLENRLRARMVESGSPEYELTWKRWDMQSGPQICALRASARLISVKDFIGWPTPTAPVKTNGHQAGNNRFVSKTMELVGWPTPNALPKNRGGLQQNPEKALERKVQGHQLNLDDAATLAGWPTPNTMTGGQTSRGGNRKGEMLINGLLAGWCTPSARDWKDSAGMSQTGVNPDGSIRNRVDQLPRQAQLVSGIDSISSDAPMEKRGVLSPEHSRWLMGFPEGWTSYADTEMP